jgi:hypothetical protein
MTGEHVKIKRFIVVGCGDIQFCPYCGVTLDEAIDHEVEKHMKNLKPILTSNCPEQKCEAQANSLFCPRCGENITTKEQQVKAKHEVKSTIDSINDKTVSTVTCPLEKKALVITFNCSEA